MASSQPDAPQAALTVPIPRRVDQVDEYHGVTVSDPYRWMETLSDPALPPWLEAETRLTEGSLAAVAGRDAVRRRLDELARAPHVEVPRMRGGRWFQMRSDGRADQPVLHVMDRPGRPGRVVFDPNTLGETIIVTNVEPSPDGTRLLWASTVGGSDWKTWHVTDVETGAAVDAEVGDAKLWAGWLPGGDAYLYIGFPSSGEGQYRQTAVPQLRVHRVGTPPQQDRVVFEDREQPRYFFPAISDDGAHCLLSFVISSGEIARCRLDDAWMFETAATAHDQLWYLGGRGDRVIAATTEGAPYGRVVDIDATQPDVERWRTIVPETNDPLRPIARCTVVGDHVLAVRDRLGLSVASMHRIDGSESWEVELPEASQFVPAESYQPASPSADGRSVYMTVATAAAPWLLVRHDLETRRSEVVERAAVATALEVRAEVVSATSADGTTVPMTVIRPAGDHDPAAPVVLEGYGGGGDAMQPYAFKPWKVAWLESGGVVASAHLRGGNELGAQWQAAAERGGKLLAMQDFIGCAEALVQRGTPPSRLAITGRSSGAMLAAAATVNRPDLFGACVAEIGMFDPLRYHLFGLGSLMIGEYGTSDDARDFEAMLQYSPLHNVRRGTSYPAFLITVHTDDDRVAPGGGYKFTAALQDAQVGSAPILLRLRAGAGHHGGTTSGEVDERADILAFLSLALGHRLA